MQTLRKILFWGGSAVILVAITGFSFLLYNEHKYIEDNGLVRAKTAVNAFETGCFRTIVGLVRPTGVDDAMAAAGLEPASGEQQAWRHPSLRLDSALLARDDGGTDCLMTFLPGHMGFEKPDHAARNAFADYTDNRFDRGMTEIDPAILNLDGLGFPRAQPRVVGFEGDLKRYYLAFEPKGDGRLTYRLVSIPLRVNQ